MEFDDIRLEDKKKTYVIVHVTKHTTIIIVLSLNIKETGFGLFVL